MFSFFKTTTNANEGCKKFKFLRRNLWTLCTGEKNSGSRSWLWLWFWLWSWLWSWSGLEGQRPPRVWNSVLCGSNHHPARQIDAARVRARVLSDVSGTASYRGRGDGFRGSEQRPLGITWEKTKETTPFGWTVLALVCALFYWSISRQ